MSFLRNKSKRVYKETEARLMPLLRYWVKLFLVELLSSRAQLCFT